jgi:hypothetical protein
MGIRRADSICRTGLCEADALLIQTAPPTLPLQLGGLKRGGAAGGGGGRGALRTCSVLHGIRSSGSMWTAASDSKSTKKRAMSGAPCIACNSRGGGGFWPLSLGFLLLVRHCLFPDANRVVCLRCVGSCQHLHYCAAACGQVVLLVWPGELKGACCLGRLTLA